MNIDFNACATFKGENQRPLLTERLVRLGRIRPTIREIADTAISRKLDAVVLRSFSHPQGTDNRWDAYVEQMKGDERFRVLGSGIAIYNPSNEDDEVLLIHGQGLQTAKGNIQVLFAEGNVGPRGDLYRTDLGYLLGAARDSGQRPLVIAQKPYAWNREDLERVDALEVWNGVDSLTNNRKAFALAAELGKPGVVSSGSKCLWDLGRSYSILPEAVYDQPTSQHVVDAIHRGLSQQRGYLGHTNTSKASRGIHVLACLEVRLTGNKD